MFDITSNDIFKAQDCYYLTITFPKIDDGTNDFKLRNILFQTPYLKYQSY